MKFVKDPENEKMLEQRAEEIREMERKDKNMTIQKNEVRKEIVEGVCDKLLDTEREALLERRGDPLFFGPMDALRAIKDRYGITWRELRAVMYSM